MIVSKETMVGLGFHVLSNHFGATAGLHHKVNNLLILACTFFILYNISVLQLDLYVVVWHGFYVLKDYFECLIH